MDRINSPEACAKKSAARRGKPPSPGAVAALVARNKLSRTPEHGQHISEALRRIGHRPPEGARLWTAEEEALLGTMPDAEVARSRDPVPPSLRRVPAGSVPRTRW
jgi:hypothetical protein